MPETSSRTCSLQAIVIEGIKREYSLGLDPTRQGGNTVNRDLMKAWTAAQGKGDEAIEAFAAENPSVHVSCTRRRLKQVASNAVKEQITDEASAAKVVASKLTAAIEFAAEASGESVATLSEPHSDVLG